MKWLRLFNNPAWISVVVASLALVVSGMSYWQSEKANRLASQLVTYDFRADDEWNVTIRHTGGADQLPDEVWVTAYLDSPGQVPDFKPFPERSVQLPAPEKGTDPLEIRLERMDQKICHWFDIRLCDPKILPRMKFRYEINGQSKSQYVRIE